jgi:hypothetical protein
LGAAHPRNLPIIPKLSRFGAILATVPDHFRN